MSDDLISRSALKKYKFTTQIYNGVEPEDIEVVPVASIDNAPTVEPKLSDEQIEKIINLLETEWGYEGIREDVSRILRGEEKRTQGEWIPVSERLPDIAKKCIVQLTDGHITIGSYHSIDKWTFQETSVRYAYPKESVIAWQPLPEPYKEVENDT